MCVEYIGNERNEQHGGGSENKDNKMETKLSKIQYGKFQEV